MAITKNTEVVGIRYHAASMQPKGVAAEEQDMFFVDTLISYTDTDTNITTKHMDSVRLTAYSDISKQDEITQAIWGIIFADTAQEHAAIALAAAAALAAATTSTVVVNP